jgi:hypothetical protein
MEDHKQACARYLAQRFRGSSDWRRCQSAKFPNDPRNPKAQRRLLELASEVDIPDHLWTSIAPYYNETESHWLAAVSDTNRDVGFRRHPRDFAEYLQNLLANLLRRY